MVKCQLQERGINDSAVLAAMRKVPRHKFVMPADIGQAYEDHPVSIGRGQTISQPYVVASMTEELRLTKNSRVLEIGTGCGYQTAVLAEIVSRVYSVECLESLQQRAIKRLRALKYRNVQTLCGDGAFGWAKHAPYDGILVTAAAPYLPEELSNQLALGGRMVIPLVSEVYGQDLYLYEKTTEGLARTCLYAVRFVPMQGAVEEE